MRYVQITIDGVTYVLREQLNGSWLLSNEEKYVEYPVEVTVTHENGKVVVIGVDDPELAEALAIMIDDGNTVSGERMFNYYPFVLQQVLELEAIIKSEGFEVDFLKNDVQLLLNEAYLITMGEERVSSWEKALGMFYSTEDTLQDRRDAVIARIRGQGKLNTRSINAIVNAFTGGTAISYVKDSALHVKITPPPNNKQYKFDNVKRELSKKVPAHLGLNVVRNYATWGEIKDNFDDWNHVSQLPAWEDVYYYVVPLQNDDVIIPS